MNRVISGEGEGWEALVLEYYFLSKQEIANAVYIDYSYASDSDWADYDSFTDEDAHEDPCLNNGLITVRHEETACSPKTREATSRSADATPKAEAPPGDYVESKTSPGPSFPRAQHDKGEYEHAGFLGRRNQGNNGEAQKRTRHQRSEGGLAKDEGRV